MAQRDTSWTLIARGLASVGGLGHLPWAPGTWATFVALGAAYLLAGLPDAAFLALCLLLVAVAIVSSRRAAESAGEPDPGWIVIDEVVGAWTSVSFADRSDLVTLALAALLFRLFDIAKPWPIRRVERRFSGGVGIVLDDLVAGLLALTCLQLLRILR